MFKFLTPAPDAVSQDTVMTNGIASSHVNKTIYRHKPLSMLTMMLAGTLLLSACQQQTEPKPEDRTAQTAEQQRAAADKPVTMSDSVKARIEQFQPLYVEQVQGLQRRLQAEYESLQAADTPVDESSLLTGTAEKTIDNSIETDDQTVITNNETATASSATISPNTAPLTANASNKSVTDDTQVEINISTEVGERDLEVLKRISLEPREPKVLTEGQIIKHYQQALQALYEPETTALSAQDTDTLLNIATLLPQLFEHAEIAEQVSVKSPALARLIVQHQVGQQIEAQQALDMQQMKQAQQQEFETLMTKFNDTIKDYDAQIAKYEETLKEFSKK